MIRTWYILIGILGSSAVWAMDPPLRPVATYSIVARDAETGQLGVAVQSHWFSVGRVVSWAEPGVGAVATQSLAEITYGPLGLEMMRAGLTSDEALRGLLAADDFANVRQVAMVDADGTVAVHTGEKSIQSYCDATGDGFSVQANLMENDTVCAAMKQAYEASDGDLGERLMVALEAAQAAGGDIRGKQSAALLVVEGDATLPAWAGRVFDLRIEDHPTPIKEMRRIFTVARGYNKMNEGDVHIMSGDMAAAKAAYGEAERLMPDNHEAMFWHAAALTNAGQLDDALPLFEKAFALWPAWRETVPRIVEAGLLPADETTTTRILAVGN